MNRMFSWITKTWNPLGGECRHGCAYCWARAMANRFMHRKYTGNARLFPREFRYLFGKDDYVFVCDMCDLFGAWVPDDAILKIIQFANRSEAKFLFLTKNPKRYKDFLMAFEDNATLGATIETDNDDNLAKAPPRTERLKAMADLDFPNKMVSVEPIMKFSPQFAKALVAIQPKFVAVGYDNYCNKLPEPKLAVTETLIITLEAFGIKVYRKTMREP